MTIQQFEQTVVERFRTLLTKPDQEMLARYYLDGHSPERVCRDLDISLAEFFERKARAKAVLTCGLRVRAPASGIRRKRARVRMGG